MNLTVGDPNYKIFTTESTHIFVQISVLTIELLGNSRNDIIQVWQFFLSPIVFFSFLFFFYHVLFTISLFNRHTNRVVLPAAPLVRCQASILHQTCAGGRLEDRRELIEASGFAGVACWAKRMKYCFSAMLPRTNRSKLRCANLWRCLFCDVGSFLLITLERPELSWNMKKK